MGFFDLFKRKKGQEATARSGTAKAAVQRTPEQVVQQGLATKGIEADTTEVAEVLKRLWNSIEFKRVLPEELAYSDSAELEFAGSKYVVRLSMFLFDESGHVSDAVLSTLMSCAVYWASASEIAKAKGEDRFTLKEGQRIALCDYTGFGEHPIYALFPDLLNKTVLR